MSESGSESDGSSESSSSGYPLASQPPQRPSQQQRTNPNHLYPPSNSSSEGSSNTFRTRTNRSSPLSLPSRQADTISNPSPTLSPLPTRPSTQNIIGPPNPQASPITQISLQTPPQPEEPNDDTLPDLTGTYLEHAAYAQEPSYFTRPNRYFGAASTWRSWTQAERTVVASLDRDRAMDLSIHLFNAHILQLRAKQSGNLGRRRSRSRSTRSQSRSRSSNRSQSTRRKSTSRGRSQSRITKGKGKDKGKARAESEDNDASDNSGSMDLNPQHPRLSSSDIDIDDPTQDQGTPFNPPRLWTAWPLPPSEVPREELLPSMNTNAHDTGISHRAPTDARPSAQLEECLIAITTRIAKERWEAREWESDDDSDDEERPRKRTRREGRKKGRVEGVATDNDIPMFSSQMFDVKSPSGSDGGSQSDSRSESDGNDDDNDDSVGSSVSNGDDDDESDASSTSTTTSPSTGGKPVVMADDAQIRELLLPSTRHVISQLDRLLAALHRVQLASRKRKKMNFGARGAEEVLGMARVVFSPDVVERARERWEGLIERAEMEL